MAKQRDSAQTGAEPDRSQSQSQGKRGAGPADSALLEKLRAGDEAAFSKLVQRYHGYNKYRARTRRLIPWVL